MSLRPAGLHSRTLSDKATKNPQPKPKNQQRKKNEGLE
jgi:hypothetical protein